MCLLAGPPEGAPLDAFFYGWASCAGGILHGELFLFMVEPVGYVDPHSWLGDHPPPQSAISRGMRGWRETGRLMDLLALSFIYLALSFISRRPFVMNLYLL